MAGQIGRNPEINLSRLRFVHHGNPHALKTCIEQNENLETPVTECERFLQLFLRDLCCCNGSRKRISYLTFEFKIEIKFL